MSAVSRPSNNDISSPTSLLRVSSGFSVELKIVFEIEYNGCPANLLDEPLYGVLS